MKAKSGEDGLPANTKPRNYCVQGFVSLLPDLDSNQDKQNQNLMCYRYTIGQ